MALVFSLRDLGTLKSVLALCHLARGVLVPDFSQADLGELSALEWLLLSLKAYLFFAGNQRVESPPESSNF